MSRLTNTASSSAPSVREGMAAIVALLLAFAAFDDITTGNETDFTVEYLALILSAIVLLFVSLRQLRSHRYFIACASLAALAGALWAVPALKQGAVPAPWNEYVVTLYAFVWFGALALQLLVSGFIASRRAL